MELSVNIRKATGKGVKSLRGEGKVPGIVYGRSLKDPVLVDFDKQEFIRLYNKTGYSTPFNLKGDSIDQLVLIHDIALDPVTDYVLHVDFLGLKKGEKVHTTVSVVIEGLSPVEKLGEGRVQQIKREVEVSAMPNDLPHDIKVDVSKMKSVNDVIFVKDLIVGSGVEILDDPELPIVTIMSLGDDSEEEVAVSENPAGDANNS